MAIAQVVSSSYIVALVPQNDSEPVWKKTHFYLWDNTHSEMLNSVNLNSPILSLSARSEYILAATTTGIHIYSTDLGQVLQTYPIPTTSFFPPFGSMTSEPTPFSASFPTPEKSHLALCRSKGVDDDNDIFDLVTSGVYTKIPEERTSYSAFSKDGSLLAVAAAGGTRIAVYDTVKGTLIACFRRGRSPATMTAMVFSEDNTMLAVASFHGTIHIFGIAGEAKRMGESTQNAAAAAGLATLPCPQTMLTMAFVEEEIKRLVVVGCDGTYSVYGLSVANGKLFVKVETKNDKLDLN